MRVVDIGGSRCEGQVGSVETVGYPKQMTLLIGYRHEYTENRRDLLEVAKTE